MTGTYDPELDLLYWGTSNPGPDFDRNGFLFILERTDGALVRVTPFGRPTWARGNPQMGYVKAFDPSTGKEVWSWKNDKPMVSSVLATGGDVVFAGEPTGEFNAYHARTGELLWQYQTGTGLHSSPVTYSVKGKQYVAVPAGWGGWVKGFAPDMMGAPRGNALFVFALP